MFVQGCLFAFPDGLLRINVGVPLALPSSLPFPSLSGLRCGEPVGEGERGRPIPLPFLFGSCFDAHASPNENCPFVIQRMQSPLSELFLAFSLHISFSRSSNCRSVLVSIFGIFDFLLEMSLDHQRQFAIIISLVAKCLLLSVGWQHLFEFIRLFILHLVKTLRYAVGRSVSDCWQYFVPLGIDGLDVVVLQFGHLINL